MRGADIDVARGAFVKSFDRFVREAAPKIELARKSKKRTERLAFKGHRQKSDVLARRAVLDLMTDREVPHPAMVDSLVERIFGPEVLDYLRESDGLSRITAHLSVMSLVVLRQKVKESSREDIRWGASVGRTMMEYGMILAEYLDLTGEENADARVRALGKLGKTASRLGISLDLGAAFLAPAMLIFGFSNRAEVTRAADVCRAEMPILKASVAIAKELPEQLRPSLGLGGLAFVAGLPANQANQLVDQFRTWLDEHPDMAEGVYVNATLLNDSEAG